MSLEAELHVAYKFVNCPVINFPFPHFFVENVFPDDFYSKIQENLLEPKEMTPIADLYKDNVALVKYKDRLIMDFTLEESMQKLGKEKKEFWTAFEKNFLSGSFGQIIQAKFKKFTDMRFQYLDNVSYRHEMFLINDKKNYSLGPHTDKISKVVSVLIYLPKDRSQIETGTSIYMPKNPENLNMEDPNQHYSREEFHKVVTMPFIPNSAFCFIKTNNSFHGLEKLVHVNTDRWSLQYNMHINSETVEKEILAKREHLKKN